MKTYYIGVSKVGVMPNYRKDGLQIESDSASEALEKVSEIWPQAVAAGMARYVMEKDAFEA